MKFTIKKSEFLKSLIQVGKIIPIKNSNPIYINVKLELTTDSLILTGSNGELSIISSIPFFKNNEEIIRDVYQGSILLNNSILTDIAKKCDGEEITLDVLEDNIVKIEANNTSFKLNSINADEYVDIDFKLRGVKVTLNAQDIVDAVSQVGFAVSVKTTNPVLTGINFEGNGSTVCFLATDGSKLAKKDIKAECLERFTTTIPSRTFQEIARSITSEKQINIYVNDKRILVELDNTIISSVLLHGTYPNIKNIIPKNFFYTLEVESQDIIKAIETANVFSLTTGERGAVIKAYFSQNNIVFSCNSIQNGSSSVPLTRFKYTGERFDISFNSELVLSAIKALKQGELVLSFQGEMKPFVIVSKNDDSVVQLLTPVRSR